jgi:hypothetical protein
MQVHSQLEGLIFTALTSGTTDWTGFTHPNLYEIFLDVRPDMMEPPCVSFDAVAVVRERRNTPLVLHGIEVVGALFDPSARFNFENRAPYCDALWMAVHQEIGKISSRTVPQYVGILRVREGGLVVDRPATRVGTVGTKTGSLAKGVLLKCFHR